MNLSTKRKQLEYIKHRLPEDMYNKLLKGVEEHEKHLSKVKMENSIPVGRKVKVVLPEESLQVNEQRFNELIGYEAICIGTNDSPYYFYNLWFIDEKAREIHTKGHNIHFNPSYLQEIGKDEDAYQAYLDWKEREEERKRYWWGKCKKCEGPMAKNFHLWCPNCEKPEKDEEGGLNYFKMIDYLTSHYKEVNIKEHMKEYISSKLSVQNMSFHNLHLYDEKASSEVQQIFQLIKNNWETEDNQILLFFYW